MADTQETNGKETIRDIRNDVHIQSDESDHGNLVPKGSTLFTKREWTMRYAAPFKALMFMAAPMVVIMIVNSLYGIIDKQLALNFAIDNVTHLMGVPTNINGAWQQIVGTNYGIPVDAAGQKQFAQILINASTQYSNTVITLLEAMSLLTSVGTAIKWGQAMGERNKQRMDSIVVMGLIQSLIMSGCGILLLHFVGPYIITSQANTPYSLHDDSLIFILSNSYTQMFIWGFPILVFATFISTLIRTEGKVWWVIFINVSAICINIGCGEAFMEHAAPANKMQSAVYGSFIAWGWMIVSGLAVIGFSKNTLLKPALKNVRLTWKDAGIIWLYGISPFVSNFIFAIANYVTTLLITIAHTWTDPENIKSTIKVAWYSGTGGDYSITGDPKSVFYISRSLQTLSSAFPWMNILYAPILGMMQGANANYAYCKGAGKRFRMIQIWRIHLMIDIIWGVCVLVIIAAAGGPMMEAFGYQDPGVHRWWFFAYICGIMFAGMTYAAISLFQGTGDSFNATLVAVLRSLVCNVGFVVIGWAIAKSVSVTPEKDWIIFLLNGLGEIPAVIVGMIIIWRYLARLIKQYKVNDLPDSFVAPSLLTAARNEVTIWQDSLSDKAHKWYLRKIGRIDKKIENFESKQKEAYWDLHIKESQLEDADKPQAVKNKLTSKWEAKAKKIYDKYEEPKNELIKLRPKEVDKLNKELEYKLELLGYKADYKEARAVERYRFRNQSLGNGTGEIAEKQLTEWKEQQDYDLLMSESLDFAGEQAAIDKAYEHKLAEVEKEKAKKLAYLKRIEDGEKVLNPLTLLFVGQEPQPLNRKEEVMADQEKAMALRKQKAKARLRLNKRKALVANVGTQADIRKKHKKLSKKKFHKLINKKNPD